LRRRIHRSGRADGRIRGGCELPLALPATVVHPAKQQRKLTRTKALTVLMARAYAAMTGGLSPSDT
jgi:hypothetical protein